MKISLRCKKIFLILIFSIFSLFLFATAQTVKVGWYIQEKYQNVSDSGDPYGYIYDFLQKISTYNNWNYTFIYDSFSNCIEMLNNGEIDILGCIVKTEEREEIFSFPQIPIGITYRYLYTRADSPLTPENYKNAENLQIGVIGNSYNISAYEKFINSENKNYEFIECDNTDIINKMLADNYVDVAISSTLPKLSDIKLLAEFYPQPFYIAVTKSRDDILQELDIALTNLNYTNPEFINNLNIKYGLNTSFSQNQITYEEKQFAKEFDTLNVAWAPNWAPLTLETEDSVFSGYIRDILDSISSLTGLKFNYIKYNTSEELYDLVQNGKVDIVSLYTDITSGFFSEQFNTSDTIISLPMQIIKKENKQSQSKKIGLLLDEKNYSSLLDFFNYDLLHFSTIKDGLNAVEKEEIDFLVTNTYTANYYLEKASYSNLYGITLQGNPIHLKFGINNKLPINLVKLINKAINNISDSTRNDFLIHSLILTNKKYNRSFFDYIFNIPFPVLVISHILFIVAIISFIIIIRKKNKYSKFLCDKLFTDNLTHLLSKDGFDSLLSKKLEKNPCDSYCIIAFDIDHFEHYNALFGFEAGDELLKNIGKVFIKFCPKDELCARLNSDHFVLFANEKDLSAEERIEQLKNNIQILSPNYKLYFNFGVYRISSGLYEPAKMRDFAKAALRSTKGDSIRYIGYYDQKLHDQLLRESLMSAEMEEALKNREFVVYFQPKYGCSSEKPVGAEALVRWRKSNGELVPPGIFISLFERNGFVQKLDMYVFEETCKVLANQIACGISPVPISTNFSRIHMYNRSFAKNLAEIAGKYNIPPHLLEIEITENAFTSNPVYLISLIESLHGYGFLVSVDDFGSGYSSLNLIKEIRFDIIKIDQIFFRHNKNISRTKSIIQCILALAKELGMRTVAEGVETEDQFKFLKENECDTIQGFYFSKPLEEEIFTRLLASNDSADI